MWKLTAMSTCYNPFSLEGKRILVTGASSGIGKAIAIECSRLGANVIVSGRNEERLAQTLSKLEGEGHKIIKADLTVKNETDELVANVDLLDGCVLCLGITHLSPFKFATREKLDEVFNANFFAPIELLRLLVKHNHLNKGSSVVCLSSVGGNFSCENGLGMYGSTKAALSSMMKFAARELSPKKIRVNSLCPGMTQTAMAEPGIVTSEQLRADMERYPLKRYGEPRDIALAAVYFLSEASSWITGTDFLIDGGLSLT